MASNIDFNLLLKNSIRNLLKILQKFFVFLKATSETSPKAQIAIKTLDGLHEAAKREGNVIFNQPFDQLGSPPKMPLVETKSDVLHCRTTIRACCMPSSFDWYQWGLAWSLLSDINSELFVILKPKSHSILRFLERKKSSIRRLSYYARSPPRLDKNPPWNRTRWPSTA